MPFNKMLDWLNKEKERGIEEPYCAILATVAANGIPHSRVIAIREIDTNSLIFFTSQKTRKVTELLNNPAASLNFLLAMQQRQITLEGIVSPLSREENNTFWQTLPKERQLRFSAYAPFSGQIIQDLDELEKRKEKLVEQFVHQSIPMSEFYYGFRFIPKTFIFYAVSSSSFSEVMKYSKEKDTWQQQLLSP